MSTSSTTRGRYAQHCLDHCLDNGIGDWDLAFAYEALAQAHRVAGNAEEHRRNLELAREAGAAIEQAADREHLGQELADL